MFDVLTMAALADELSTSIVAGRIQRIGLIDRLTVGMEVYAERRRRWLVLSADSQRARVVLGDQAVSLDPALITPFGLLLRKYLRGATIVSVENPALERVLRITVGKRILPINDPQVAATPGFIDHPSGVRFVVESESDGDNTEENLDALDRQIEAEEAEDDDSGTLYLHLVAELMGRHSNLILVDDDGVIMESAKRVTQSMSRVRPIWPRTAYTPPPPVDKPDPRRVTAPDAAQLLASARQDAPLGPLLVRTFRAVSPQIAREVAFRAAGDADATVASLSGDHGPTVLARETRRLYEPMLTAEWEPRFYRNRETDEVVAFAPFPLLHLQESTDEEEAATISEAAIAAEEAELPGSVTTHLQRRARLSEAIRDARDRLVGRLASLDAQQEKAAASDQYRTWGELIYAYLWQISRGQTELVVDGVTIPLDTKLSPKDNAKAYFERYRKAQGAASALPELRAQAEHEIGYLDQLLVLVQQAHGFAEIEALANEWGANRPGSLDAPTNTGNRPKPRKDTPGRPKPIRDADGNAIYIGHSGRQNDLVTFDLAGPEDTWLHARGVPGSHVIVRWRIPGMEEDPETIEAAAALAAYYSAARNAATVEVDVTKRKYVRKIKGAGPGMVTYRQERTIAVRPMVESALPALS